MIYCILSDIHSNYPALASVLNDADKNFHIDEFICLGDIVGYGPYPNKCIELIKSRCSIICAGNHDYAVVKKIDITDFNDYAKTAIEWTSSALTDVNLVFLNSLEPYALYQDIEFTHASLSDPVSEYIINVWSAVSNFKLLKTKICFNGHTHVPVVFYQINEHKEAHAFRFEMNPEYYILEDNKYIINAGSIGQPRDHDPRASYMIYDTEKCLVLNRRVEYDIKETQKAMAEASLPQFLIERLESGK